MDIAWLPERRFVLGFLFDYLVSFELGKGVQLVIGLVSSEPGNREDLRFRGYCFENSSDIGVRIYNPLLLLFWLRIFHFIIINS